MKLVQKQGQGYRQRFDDVKIGLAAGIIAPIIVFLLYYIIFHRHMDFFYFLKYLKDGDIFIATLSLCVIINLLLFFICLWTNRDRTARGVVMATFLYAIYVAIMKSI